MYIIEAIKQLKVAIVFLLLITLLTGVMYPMLVTSIAQLLFPFQANGSFIKQDNVVVGSLLIGQSFSDPKYFWGRPSATTPFPYNAVNSSGSNMGPLNASFLASVKARVLALETTNANNKSLVPGDMVFASGSGLNPEISPLAAFYQVGRIAKVRGIPEQDVRAIIKNTLKGRTFGILGEPRVNVLELNLALDKVVYQKEKK